MNIFTLTLVALMADGSLLAAVELEKVSREQPTFDAVLYNQIQLLSLDAPVWISVSPLTIASSAGWLIKWGLISSAVIGIINEDCILAAPAQGVGCLLIAIVVAVLSRILHKKHLPDKLPPALLPRLCSGTIVLFYMPVLLPYVVAMFS